MTAQSGVAVAEVCRAHGMSDGTFYKWRSRYGRMDAKMISEQKALQEENRRLKKMHAKVQLQKEMLQDVMRKKW